jgi:hypothetical protein
MPILGGIALLIQLCFAYHALKSGRPYWWIFVIMAFPVMGCVLYYFIEVFPSSRESRSAHKAARAIAKRVDPDKDLRARVADVEACGSVDNRIMLARECMEQRMYPEAAALYRSCLAGVYESDPEIRYCLGAALLQQSKHDEALALAQRLRASHPTFRSVEVGLVNRPGTRRRKPARRSAHGVPHPRRHVPGRGGPLALWCAAQSPGPCTRRAGGVPPHAAQCRAPA